MSINRIELQGQITRAQDYTTIKQNEDNKGMVDQNNFQTQFHREIDQKMNQVHRGEDTRNDGKKYDAKEKGGTEYSGDGGKGRKKDDGDRRPDGKVTVKTGKGGMGSFDMKI